MSSFVFTFRSTHSAIMAQSLLKEAVDFQVMPVPREISASCGIAIRLEEQSLQKAKELLAASSLEREEYALYALAADAQGQQTVKKLL